MTGLADVPAIIPILVNEAVPPANSSDENYLLESTFCLKLNKSSLIFFIDFSFTFLIFGTNNPLGVSNAIDKL